MSVQRPPSLPVRGAAAGAARAPHRMDAVPDDPQVRDLADRRMRRLPEGALGAIAEITVKVTDTVNKAEVDAIAAWKAKEIGDMDLLERLRGLRARP